jgi:hypothetical protein
MLFKNMSHLYQHSLLYLFPETKQKALWHQGVIQAPLLFLIQTENDLAPELLEMLQKIVAALKLSIDQVECITINKSCIVSQIAQLYQAKSLVCFGFEAQDLFLNMNLQRYHLYEFDAYKLILVNDVIDIYSNQALKTKLWALLQKI